MADKTMQNQSKSLSWLLRHGGPGIGLNIDDEGYADLADIVAIAKKGRRLDNLVGLTVDGFKKIAETDAKNRYNLVKIDDRGLLESYKIRANQGHSFSVPNLELVEVDPKECPIVVHGTDYDAWKLIQGCGYLSSMTREYMHFTEEHMFNKLGRKQSPVVLKFDVKKAFADGIKFYRAKNNVILCKGIDGRLPLIYLVR